MLSSLASNGWTELLNRFELLSINILYGLQINMLKG